MKNKDLVYDFLVRLYNRYPVDQQLHLTASSYLEQLCEGASPDEREEIFDELEQAYMFRYGMERSASRLKMLHEVISTGKEPELMVRNIKEFKQEFALFEECKRYGGEMMDRYIERVNDYLTQKEGGTYLFGDMDMVEEWDESCEDDIDVEFTPDDGWDLDGDYDSGDKGDGYEDADDEETDDSILGDDIDIDWDGILGDEDTDPEED